MNSIQMAILFEMANHKEHFHVRGHIFRIAVSCFRTEKPRKKGGLGTMNIPLLSDITKQISKDYGVLLEDQGVALRLEDFEMLVHILTHLTHL